MRGLAALLLAGCAAAGEPPGADRAALLDADACQGCHPVHHQEWAASMHAHASDDPVFLAMNRRGQRETGGALGDFCVKCHAPMAVRQGLTRDGLNLADVPRSHRGVTCTFCHSIERVTGSHDNPVVLASDGALLGPIADPRPNPFHRSRHGRLLDSTVVEAASACGSCHDIVNQQGAAIERTFAEWRGSLFASPQVGQGCGGCHLPGRDGPAALGGPLRRVHDHRMPGVDVALTPWPGVDDQKQAIVEQLGSSLQGALCLDERSNRMSAILDNVGAGHMWPSGAAADRRAWVELVAETDGQVLPQTDRWMIRDCLYDGAGREVHMFWEATRFASNLLPPSPLLVPGVRPAPRGHLRWESAPLPVVPDRITMRVFIRPIGEEVLQDLVASGDLDPRVAAAMPTFEVAGGKLEWTRAAVNYTTIERGAPVACVAPIGFGGPTIPAVSHERCP